MTGTAAPFVVGVDGGNTKTVALVATLDGTVVGVGRGGGSDIYGAPSTEAALAELETAVHEALAVAGLGGRSPLAGAFCLAGADWPEDFDLYRVELGRRLRWDVGPLVANDALAGLWAATQPGVGVCIACGTWSAVGARTSEGATWHSSFWTEPSGAAAIAQDALTAAIRSELGIADADSLTSRLLAHHGAADVGELLHRFTRWAGKTSVDERARAASVVLTAAEAGDDVALSIVRHHGELLATYALAGARKVGMLGKPFCVTLTGGVFRHPTRVLADRIASRVQAEEPLATVERSDLPPAAGAVHLALVEAGVSAQAVHAESLRSSLATFYEEENREPHPDR